MCEILHCCSDFLARETVVVGGREEEGKGEGRVEVGRVALCSGEGVRQVRVLVTVRLGTV